MRQPVLRGLTVLRARLNDLLITLVWAAALAGIWLNTFFHRDCLQFIAGTILTTCQSPQDLGLIFAVALGAGLAIESGKAAALGFLFSHIIASFLFIVALSIPVLMGFTDQALSTSIENISLVIVFWSQFPFGLFFSLVGSWGGAYVRIMLGLSKE